MYRYNFEKAFYIFVAIQENTTQNTILKKYSIATIKIQEYSDKRIQFRKIFYSKLACMQ